jgi:hypothetical protein
MGSSFSSCCCGRRRKRPRSSYYPSEYDSQSRDPLLPPHHQPPEPEKSTLIKLADVIAAAREGKLPSQNQLDRVARRLLRSEVLKLPNGNGNGTNGYSVAGGHGGRALSAEGTNAVLRIREVLQAGMVFGLEKNGEYPS